MASSISSAAITDGDFLAGSPYPVALLGPDGRILHASDRARRLLADRDGTPGWLRRAHLALPDDGPRPRPVRHTDPMAGPVEAHPTRRPDGSAVWWFVSREDRPAGPSPADGGGPHDWELLARLSGLLLSSLNADRVLETAARQAALHLADAAVLVAPGSGRVLRLVTCLRGADPAHAQVRADPAEVPGLAEALRGFPPVPSRWIDPGAAPHWLVPDGFGRVGSVLVTPLPGHGVPAGALVLLRTPAAGPFDPAEESFARMFAVRAGAAVSAAVMYSEQAAVTDLLMRELLPPRLEHLDGVDFAGGYRASGDRDRIGGDFYDVHPAAEPGGETLALLGDVSGKGLEAAVMTGKVRNTLHALLPLADDHQRVLHLLNRALLTSRHTRFASLVLASVRREDDRVRVRLSAAGHPAPMVVRADGRVTESTTLGSIVGVLPEATTRTDTVLLDPGEACVLYSDGITEAKGGPTGREQFGDHRLRRALAECAGLPAEAIVERVQMLAAQWLRENRHDDMAVMVIAAPPRGHVPVIGRQRGLPE
ncbi:MULTISPECIES: SpoIIE family protein phosphatase [Kitasatospora]|uniref:Putative serine/threonine protein phosphatase n=1 Tax=Kitasatospora setae (strain ATCC 33774 / DSM 43861 / JCM 3304 / KCC A-0304 / NBRC 14216 / KM-6054) TaxID=452652 RepID=E4N574_KITSK|nr:MULTISPECIES: SpoIIE family protein phosphatase [Kitasatospora]BAJ26355.1 putative serine/threonine protein phosphatase [Kitasatospora setae KM-6054]